jgi:WbqC-like protein family
MTISIHQPNYLPWIGYFYKIWASDIFILHDNVEYTKHSFTKRVFIRKYPATSEKDYIIVPLKRHSDFALISDLKICHEQNWQQKQINKIYYVYHKAPFFNDYFPVLEQSILVSRDLTYLADFNKNLILDILGFLNIDRKIVLSSELPVRGFQADEYNAQLVAYFGGDLYISGTGAKKYQFNMTYANRGISLIYNELGRYLKKYPPQYPIQFDAGLSILDALFYIGEAGILDIFKAYQYAALKKKEHESLVLVY